MNVDKSTQTTWHTQSVEDAFSLLDSKEYGLGKAEAAIRLQKYGRNMLPEVKQGNLLHVFIRQFQSPLIYLLLVAAGAVSVAGKIEDAYIILAVLLLNATIGTIQEGRAQNTLAGLRRFVETRATVLRDGKEVIISDKVIVPGDVLIMQEGERVPVDARLITVRNFGVDEAALTGESTIVYKITSAIYGENTPVADRRNMVFKGTHVATGTAKALVVNTGINTEIGHIASEIISIDSNTPLKADMERLARVIIFVSIGIAVLLFTIGIYMDKTPGEMFLTVVSLLVSIVPEGLPIVLTLVLATGVWRMGKQNALVKRMHAVEALGQVDILAIDKTGTITKNEMMVQKIYTAEKFFVIGGVGYEPQGDVRFAGEAIDPVNHSELLLVGKTSAFCASARVVWSEENKQWNLSGDPTEAAMLVLSQKLGFHRDTLEQESPIVGEIPFDYKLKYHAVLNRTNKVSTLSLAGAPEIILDLCSTTWRNGGYAEIGTREREEIETVLLSLFKEGFRVIALATCNESEGLPKEGRMSNATFIGFLCMKDAMRPEVVRTILSVREAGIMPVMVTGDHRITALSIARDADIYRQGDKVLTGSEIELLSDHELVNAITNVSVFARVTPEHKLRIIRAYKSSGKIIAMTGDGVNDAPSLSAADLGISMGRVGTEVAKDVSDIVLLGDNMGSIVSAIEEGRGIYKTIKKVILYLFSTSAGEVLTIAGAILLGFIIPILPVQIIWLNFVTDGFLDTALAMEPKEKGLLYETRNRESRHLIDNLMIVRIVAMASVMAAGTLYLFKDYVGDPAKALTVSLTLLAVFQWFNAWNCRSERFSVLQMNPFSNLFLIGATVMVVVLQMGALYTSAGQKFLHTVPLSLSDWKMIIMIASSIVVVEEVRKFIHRTRDVKIHPKMV